MEDELNQLPLCLTCKERHDIRLAVNHNNTVVYTLNCGHRQKINPDRGTVVERYMKEGKQMQKIDNRMYLPVEDELAEKDRELAATNIRIQELEKELAAASKSK